MVNLTRNPKELKPVLYKQWIIRIESDISNMHNNMTIYRYKTDPKNIEPGSVLFHIFGYPWLPIPFGEVKTKKEAIEYAKIMIDRR